MEITDSSADDSGKSGEEDDVGKRVRGILIMLCSESG